jgi:hypothetical protein
MDVLHCDLLLALAAVAIEGIEDRRAFASCSRFGELAFPRNALMQFVGALSGACLPPQGSHRERTTCQDGLRS